MCREQSMDRWIHGGGGGSSWRGGGVWKGDLASGRLPFLGAEVRLSERARHPGVTVVHLHTHSISHAITHHTRPPPRDALLGFPQCPPGPRWPPTTPTAPAAARRTTQQPAPRANETATGRLAPWEHDERMCGSAHGSYTRGSGTSATLPGSAPPPPPSGWLASFPSPPAAIRAASNTAEGSVAITCEQRPSTPTRT